MMVRDARAAAAVRAAVRPQAPCICPKQRELETLGQPVHAARNEHLPGSVWKARCPITNACASPEAS